MNKYKGDIMEGRILQWFKFEHLQEISAPFCKLADKIVDELGRGSERIVALRKLLEAKDAAVRAKLSPGGRKDYISYDEMFMVQAAVASYRSKDPNTQNGCIIINSENRIVSMGYNGFPEGCSDDIFPWTSSEKYPYSEHSERNAIYNACCMGRSLKDCSLYLFSSRGYYPCSDCARAIIQVGIKSIFMACAENGDTSHSGAYGWEPTKKMFKAAGVNWRLIKNVSMSFIQIAHNLRKSATIIDEVNGEYR
jgi:dCMP deaminase